MKMVLVGFALFFVLINSAYALLEIKPSSETLSVFSDAYFFINITISGVDDVYGFQLDLGFNNSIFEIWNVSEGTFLSRNGQDSTYCINPDFSTSGLVDNFACSRIGVDSISGSGVIAKMIFRLKPLKASPSEGNFALSSVKVSDRSSQPLDNSSQDGIATVYECLSGETRSCVVGEYEGTKTCGTDNSWGNCIVYTDGNGNGGGPSGGPGFYPGPQEETNGEEEYAYPADINGDGCVDLQDLILIAKDFGLSSGFDERVDINGDGEIDIVDLVLVALKFGTGPNCL
jgi:hypothetical protein